MDERRNNDDEAARARGARLSRRELLTRAALAGAAVPSLGAVLAACAAPSPAGPAAGAGAGSAAVTLDPAAKITIALTNDFKTLDPPFYTTVGERQALYSIYSPLLELDEKLDLVPNLIESWDVQDGGTTIILKVRKGVKFHDGTDLDAAAVKFNLDRILDPKNAAPQRSNIDQVSKVDVTDPLTVRLTLATAYTPLLGFLSEGPGFVVSPTAILKYGKDFGQNPVGTGPFQLLEWRKADQLILKRFDGYWKPGLPKAAQVILKPIPDETVRMANLQEGTIDIVEDVPPQDRAKVRTNPDYEHWDEAGTRWPMVRLNLKKAPLDNKLVRQAIASAINRDDIIKAVYFGEAVPAYGPISPLYGSFYDPEVEKYGFKYDLAAAKAKLAASGATNVSFQIDVQNQQSQQRMAEVIRANLAAIGINMTIQQYESTAWTDRVNKRAYQATLGSWTLRADIDGTIYRHYALDGNQNSMGYENAQVDALLKRSRTLPNGPERVKTFRDAQKLIVDDAPWIFLLFEKQQRAWRKSVTALPKIADTMPRTDGVGRKK